MLGYGRPIRSLSVLFFHFFIERRSRGRMDTLMRILKTWLLVLLFIVGVASLADAQSAQGTPAAQAERFFFDLSWGGQSREQTFTTSSTFSIYNEQGAVAGAQSIGGGTLFDVGAGVNLWRAFGVGIAYSTVDEPQRRDGRRPRTASAHLRTIARSDGDGVGSRTFRRCRPSAVPMDRSGYQQDSGGIDARAFVLHRAAGHRHGRGAARHQRSPAVITASRSRA